MTGTHTESEPLLRHRVRLGVRVPAADGVRLNTDVVLPDGPGPFPAVLIRTPYGTGSMMKEAMGWAAQGLAAVVQDVRGRFESQGQWQPWVGELADGLASLRWLRRQPWCDGRVIAYGSSYGAHCALELALAAQARLTGVIVAVPALSHAQTIREPSGVPRLLAHAWWWPSHGERRVPHGPVIDALRLLDRDVLHTLPVADLPQRWGGDPGSWLRAWATDRPPVPAGRPGAPPLLVVGGRHDAYADTAVELFCRWRGAGAHLVLGPWGHDLGLGAPRPPARSARHRIRPGMLVRGWVGDLLAGGPRGRRRWLAATDGGGADGSVLWWAGEQWPDRSTEQAPDVLSPMDFPADPADPYPAAVDTEDVTAALERPDHALFRLPAVTGEITVIGSPEVTLTGLARLDATAPGPLDWVVRLLRISGTGVARQLAHAAVRTGADHATVELPPVADRLPAGDRLAVQVTGHLFPVFPRDPQDGTDPLHAVRLWPAVRRVGGVGLRLPLLPADGTSVQVRPDQLPGAWL